MKTDMLKLVIHEIFSQVTGMHNYAYNLYFIALHRKKINDISVTIILLQQASED